MLRGYDVIIVRLLPFLLFIEMGICSLLTQYGVNPNEFYILHSNSAVYATALFFISLVNRHYHCNWNRAMYIFLIVVPIFNYIDAKFSIVPSVDIYLLIFHIAYGVTAIITGFMATHHFIVSFKHRH